MDGHRGLITEGFLLNTELNRTGAFTIRQKSKYSRIRQLLCTPVSSYSITPTNFPDENFSCNFIGEINFLLHV